MARKIIGIGLVIFCAASPLPREGLHIVQATPLQTSPSLISSVSIPTYSNIGTYSAKSVINNYDSAGRLIRQTVTDKNLVIVYSYDKNGNLISRKVDAAPPTAPGKVITSFIRENAATMNWNLSSDDRGVDYYEYTLTSNGQEKKGRLSPTATSIHLTGLIPSTTYTFSIKAVDIAARSSSVSSITIRTKDLTIPTKPVLTSLVGDGPTLSVSWSPSSDPDGIKEYILFLNGNEYLRTKATSVTLTNLPFRSNMVIKVQAIDIYEYASETSTSPTVYLIPSNEIEKVSENDNSRDTFVLEWWSNNKKIVKYRVSRKSDYIDSGRGGGGPGNGTYALPGLGGGKSFSTVDYTTSPTYRFYYEIGRYNHTITVEGLDASDNVVARSSEWVVQTLIPTPVGPGGYY
ncbi:fibronectin type III domain-containing protein [Gorillibacterium sp. CAU 1737]|uniref:fibronectin type III domain-containing protein n=1 Tax=Gorillibacterium sp. CAU 1737 TaxID=3140362 RepID=UPI0032608CED